MTMELVKDPEGPIIVANGADPQQVRLNCCSSCPVNYCTQMLARENNRHFARIILPRNAEAEVVDVRIKYVNENARCLKG